MVPLISVIGEAASFANEAALRIDSSVYEWVDKRFYLALIIFIISRSSFFTYLIEKISKD